jgi:hypothetical protein
MDRAVWHSLRRMTHHAASPLACRFFYVLTRMGPGMIGMRR